MVYSGVRLCFRFSSLLHQTRRSIRFGLLDSRCLIRIQGDSAADFLQGLITNDIHSISAPRSFIYAMFLNVKGRIMTDTFIYHLQDDSKQGKFLIEVDCAYEQQLFAHLARYNLRRKVKIERDPNIAIWIAMPSFSDSTLAKSHSWMPIEQPKVGSTTSDDSLYFYAPDPRGIAGWSGRVLLKAGISANSIFTASESTSSTTTISDYNQARWGLGLPEGTGELISNETLPLEANADLSGAVSFSKGCYIGQELTARTRFTGVVRRRYLPVQVQLIDPISVKLVPGCHHLNAPIYISSKIEEAMTNPKSRPMGWLRAIQVNTADSVHANGLALVRLTEVGNPNGKNNELCVALPANPPFSSTPTILPILPTVPSWWPDHHVNSESSTRQ